MEPATILLILAAVFGLYMAWGIGANDVANAMATSVGAGAVTVGGAILIAAVFEFLGAFLAGGEVTATIRKGIIDADLLADDPTMLVHGMLASLLAAAVWLTIASRYGWPVSTTHSIVGAIVGFAVVAIGFDAVHWDEVGSITASWVISPMLAGSLSFLLVLSVQRLIFDTADPEAAARRYVPLYIFATATMIALVTVLKGLRHVGLDISPVAGVGYALGFGAVVAVIGAFVIRRLRFEPPAAGGFRFANVEKVFAILMVVTACAMAFAHGSNDVANAIGPVAAVVSIVNTGAVLQEAAVATWVLLLGAVGIVVGLATFGFRVMATVGRNITELTPSRGFAAELAAASTVVVASATGIPISTTHTLVGAVLGVGLARGISALDLGVIRTIFMSWIVTLPAGAILAVVFYYILSSLLGP
ncbi:MAG: inorganic phosphate transporter [Gammaproteobacteria bacterium]|nr:inorganic phosphate transporter [Gammaproteobacteria bacterium]